MTFSLTASSPFTSLADASILSSMHSFTMAAFIAAPRRSRSMAAMAGMHLEPASFEQVLVPQQTNQALQRTLDSFQPPTTLATPIIAVPPTKSLRYKLGLPEQHATSSTRLFSKTRPKVVGHRGALYDALENTVPGFVRCAELGCDSVELDVFLLKDGNTVVFHGGGTDENPGDLSDYCIGRKGQSILDLTLDQAQQLVFNPFHAELPCPSSCIQNAVIPTLEDVLVALAPYKELEIKIELKGPGTVQPTLDIVERHHMQQQCSYSSFDLDRLRELRALRPDKAQYPTGALFTEPPADYIALAEGATEIHLQYDQCTASRIAEIHAAGFKSMAWFRGPVGMQADASQKYWDIVGEDADCYQDVIDTGVQQLCVNKPDILTRLLQQQQHWL